MSLSLPNFNSALSTLGIPTDVGGLAAAIVGQVVMGKLVSTVTGALPGVTSDVSKMTGITAPASGGVVTTGASITAAAFSSMSADAQKAILAAGYHIV